MKKTMYEKIWDNHLVVEETGKAPIIYVDRHLMHEATSPQALEGLRLSNHKVRNSYSILANTNHCVLTKDRKYDEIAATRGDSYYSEIEPFREEFLLNESDVLV